MDGICKKVAGVSDEQDKTALNLRKPSDHGILEEQTGTNADDETNDQTTKEYEQEDPDRLEQADDGQVAFRCAFPILLSGLKQHNGNSIVKYGLAEDDCVELGVHFVGVEDCQNCDRICGGEGRADCHGFDKGDVKPF